eukprot:m.21916 g.21916  ORF g.21916 m.21916 type:complete len:610 (+) comp8340_c0_seq1:235-2064(+)
MALWNPFALDDRACVLFRVSLALFVLCDLASRVAMPGSLYWYTDSKLEPASVLNSVDTPHRAPLHKVWFFRGSLDFQMLVFGIHFIVATLHLLGIYPRLSTLALWFATTAMHGRQECFHDGSDKYMRNLLLLSCFLPNRRKALRNQVTKPKGKVGLSSIMTTSGSVAVVLQIVLMYAGVLYRRIFTGSPWMPSQGTAVGHAAVGSFAARGPLLPYLVTQDVSWVLSVGAMFGELFMPVVILLTTSAQWTRLLAFVAAIGIHGGIYAMFNLPQWSSIAVIATLCLMPSPALDALERLFPKACSVIWGLSDNNNSDISHDTSDGISTGAITPETPSAVDVSGGEVNTIVRQRQSVKQGVDGDHKSDATEEDGIMSRRSSEDVDQSKKSARNKARSPRPVSLVRNIIGAAFIALMVYEWGATDGFFYKSFDNGDIGQAIRFYQGWVMFSDPTIGESSYVVITARLNTTEGEPVLLDMLKTVRTGELDPLSKSDFQQLMQVPECIQCTYPSWRYERFIQQWQQKNGMEKLMKLRQIGRHYCHVLKGMTATTTTDKQDASSSSKLSLVVDKDTAIRLEIFAFKTLAPTATIPVFHRGDARQSFDTEYTCNDFMN